MKKSDLKALIKPLVKECIHETLIEEGYLANIVTEVAKGMQGNLVVEARPAPQRRQHANEREQIQKKTSDTRTKFAEHRKKLMDSIGSEAYNGVNLFEGVEPIRAASTQAEAKPGQVDLGDPADSGVDISSLMGGASQIWKAMK